MLFYLFAIWLSGPCLENMMCYLPIAAGAYASRETNKNNIVFLELLRNMFFLTSQQVKFLAKYSTTHEAETVLFTQYTSANIFLGLDLL